MKFITIVTIGFFSWCAISTYFAYNFISKVEPENYLGNSFFNSSNKKTKTETIEVEGIEYLVVENNNGVGVTYKLNKNNLKKLAEMVSELSDEMNSENFNNIIKDK